MARRAALRMLQWSLITMRCIWMLLETGLRNWHDRAQLKAKPPSALVMAQCISRAKRETTQASQLTYYRPKVRYLRRLTSIGRTSTIKGSLMYHLAKYCYSRRNIPRELTSISSEAGTRAMHKRVTKPGLQLCKRLVIALSTIMGMQ